MSPWGLAIAGTCALGATIVSSVQVCSISPSESPALNAGQSDSFFESFVLQILLHATNYEDPTVQVCWSLVILNLLDMNRYAPLSVVIPCVQCHPAMQRLYVRIIFLIPNYAISSFLSLLFRAYALYIETVRDMYGLPWLTCYLQCLLPHLAYMSLYGCDERMRCRYEAFVIYSFMSLLLEYIGGPGRVEAMARDRIVKGSWLYGTCCFPAMQVPLACHLLCNDRRHPNGGGWYRCTGKDTQWQCLGRDPQAQDAVTASQHWADNVNSTTCPGPFIGHPY